MLGNNEKMNMNPSTKTTNEWPENNQIDEKGLIMASSSSSATTTTRVINMEKPTLQDQQQQLLKCPRCDSSNTKFCYYNNYSLSQPRHFCKACKRYWTRGGTLRNVPVGGSCRKNKRVRRPAAASSTEVTSISLATTKPNVQTGQVDLSSSSSSSAAAAAHMNPLFYSLLTNDPSDLNLQYPRFNSRVSNIESASGFEQINGIGLGFSSSGLLASHDHNGLLSSYNNNIPNVFGSTSTTSSTMASLLLASSLHHQKLISEGFKDPNNFQNLGVYEDQVQVPRNAHVKMENGQNRFDWNVPNNNNNQNHIDQISFSDANNSLLWNSNGGIGAWLDPSNIGSSVSSLI